MKAILLRGFLFFYFFCGISLIFADQITVHNKSGENLFIAIYRYKDKATRETAVYELQAGTSRVIERPPRILFTDRELVFSLDEDIFVNVINKAQFNLMYHINIGTLKGKSFYIAERDYQLKMYNQLEWNVIEPIIKKAKALITMLPGAAQKEIKARQIVIQKNPYKGRRAVVRSGNTLSDGEKAYLRARTPKVKKALEKMLGRSLEGKYIPKIACIGSGGGCRAMLGTLGFLIGAEEIGLLDGTTYISALSGSTWMLGLWMTSLLPLKQFKDQLIFKLRNGIQHLTPDEMKLILDSFLVKYAFDQAITLVDFYGALLANTFLNNFGNERQCVYLSQQALGIQDGLRPFPIYTAVSGQFTIPHSWYEFNPYEIGNMWFNTYVPTWAFGRRFYKGVSVDDAPEQSLGFYLGTFGSAFAANFDTMYKETFLVNIKSVYKKIETGVPFGIVEKVVSRPLVMLGKRRATWGEAFNYTALMPGQPLNKKKRLKIVDAGLDFNLPYPPVSGQRTERKPDILIFFDSSATIAGVPELKKVYAYAKKHGLLLPAINFVDMDKRIITIGKNEKDPTAPVVIYMPRIKENSVWNEYKNKKEFSKYKPYLENFDPEECLKGYCNTFNFVYNNHDAHQFCALTEFNMRASKQALIDVINWVIDMKSSK